MPLIKKKEALSYPCPSLIYFGPSGGFQCDMISIQQITYPHHKLSGSAWSFGKTCLEFYKTNFPWNRLLYNQVQCYGFCNFNSGTTERFRHRYILSIVIVELQTASVAYFKRKIQLSRFSAYLDGLPSELIWVSGVLLYLPMCCYNISSPMD